jgi:ubiquinone/menaquinone biosynthesis C-methylase UbiE
MMNIILDQKRRKTQVNEGTADSYALGYSTGELNRLKLQGAFIRDLTEDVMRRAGIDRGMRVLDLGCGVGDVSLLAGEIVGPTGAVLGLDRSAEAIATAEKRAVEAGQCYWVQFAATELDDFVAEETFDAIIGRLILMYLPDPAAALRRFASHLRPDGVMAFQEMAMSATKSIPEGPLYAKCRRWLLDAFEIGGFEVEMGPRLFSTFLAAGLPSPKMIAAARVEGGPDAFAYDYLAETLRSLLPLMERLGITTAEELDVDTLAERLRSEAVANSACVMLPPLVGAWTRIPA